MLQGDASVLPQTYAFSLSRSGRGFDENVKVDILGQMIELSDIFVHLHFQRLAVTSLPCSFGTHLAITPLGSINRRPRYFGLTGLQHANTTGMDSVPVAGSVGGARSEHS